MIIPESGKYYYALVNIFGENKILEIVYFDGDLFWGYSEEYEYEINQVELLMEIPSYEELKKDKESK